MHRDWIPLRRCRRDRDSRHCGLLVFRHMVGRMKARIWIGVLIGSTIGGFVPELWGADMFSYSSVLLSGIGGFIGLWIAYKTS